MGTLGFSKVELRKAALLAREFGVSIRLYKDGSVGFSPVTNIRELTEDDVTEEELDRELKAFKLKHGYT